jgi:cell wall-associated NlpC family hydrolase
VQPRRLRRRAGALARSAGVLLACLGLAAVSLAAAGGSGKDPGATVVAVAQKHVGDLYVWGATGPDTWDCSGLTFTLWRQAGVKDIPRTSRQQQAWAVPIPAEQALAGDLVFFGDPVTHVGIVKKRTTTKGKTPGTTITMLDASSSQKGVVERTAWKTGVIRYGRVPRPGMVAVTPWKPVTPTPTAKPAPKPDPKPAPRATTGPKSDTKSGTKTGSTSTSHATAGKAALKGLPSAQKVPSTAVALKAVKLARAALGNSTLTDVELIRNVWRRAGGASLPSSRTGLNAAAHRVPLDDARIGDLIVYAAPGSHVGIYVGNGMMIDASRALGKVVLREVWAAAGVQVMRLPR